jgi:hypothetical protein
MNKLHLIIPISAILLASPLKGQNSDSAEVQLKTAMHQELVEGDQNAAYAQQVNAVLFAFLFWLSAFVGLVSLVVFVLLGVGVFMLMKEPHMVKKLS